MLEYFSLTNVVQWLTALIEQLATILNCCKVHSNVVNIRIGCDIQSFFKGAIPKTAA